MSKPRNKHRYLVAEVGEGVTAVAVGNYLIVPWHGKRHDFMTEKNGVVTYLCTAVHVEKVEDEK